MLKIGICDDDPADRAVMETAVEETFAADQIPCQVHLYKAGENLLHDVEDGDTSFDILLLDIEMPDVSGFSVSARIDVLLPEAIQIFVTDHMRYVIEAFELSTFRYIPKDQLARRLPRALRDAVKTLRRKEDRQYLIQRGGNVERLPFGSIQFVTRNGKNALLHTSQGVHSVRRTLAQVLDELDPDEFVQIDRGVIVNLAAVHAIRGNEAVLANGNALPISRKRLSEVKQRFTAYWGRFM